MRLVQVGFEILRGKATPSLSTEDPRCEALHAVPGQVRFTVDCWWLRAFLICLFFCLRVCVCVSVCVCLSLPLCSYLSVSIPLSLSVLLTHHNSI